MSEEFFRPLYLPVKKSGRFDTTCDDYNQDTGLEFKYDSRLRNYTIRKVAEGSGDTHKYFEVVLKNIPSEFDVQRILARMRKLALTPDPVRD